jgi:ribosomal-protein-alanine N-acetyltransferase
MDGRLAGYITVSEVAGELEIINVGVEPEMRGRGIATRLLQAILHQAREKSIFFYYLEVRPSNAPALSLYTRAGFRRSGVRRRYYADGEDALAMTMEAGHNLNQPQ